MKCSFHLHRVGWCESLQGEVNDKSGLGSFQNCERILYLFTWIVQVIKEMMTNGWIMGKDSCFKRMTQTTKSYIGSNDLINSGFMSLICSSYISSCTQTSDFVNNWSTSKIRQTIFNKWEKKNELVRKTIRNLAVDKTWRNKSQHIHPTFEFSTQPQ